jgi:nucleoside-diphosphate-sugar epimerase
MEVVMKIFITGSTGYIGFSVALAFRRAGHDVWGLVRSDHKARLTAMHEIHPVTGTLQDPRPWREAAASCSVLIHAAADYQEDTLAVDRQAVEALLDVAKQGPTPKTLIYTSGVWVYGNTGNNPADETATLRPPGLVVRRPQTERLVLESPDARGIVLRPGCVYGRQGGLTGMWFAGATDGALTAVGDGSNRWGMVHADDLADAYVRAAESGLGGEVFNVTDRSRWSVGDMVGAVARTAGYAGRVAFAPVSEASKTMGAFAECLALDQHVDSRKAVRLLGWQPKHGGFVDGVETFHMSWKSSR